MWPKRCSWTLQSPPSVSQRRISPTLFPMQEIQIKWKKSKGGFFLIQSPLYPSDMHKVHQTLWQIKILCGILQSLCPHSLGNRVLSNLQVLAQLFLLFWMPLSEALLLPGLIMFLPLQVRPPTTAYCESVSHPPYTSGFQSLWMFFLLQFPRPLHL